jgi:pantetheine-phosphate adenylyltransferase
MRIAVYPGSFDPISNGHLDIIERTARIFDKVYVLVSLNPNKRYIFNPQERVELLQEATAHIPNVVVEASSQLVLEYAKSRNASVIVRGMRNIYDYQSEITLFQFNHTLDSSIDTFILFPSTDNLFLSSSAIKELVMFNKPIDAYVPKGMAKKIARIIKERQTES